MTHEFFSSLFMLKFIFKRTYYTVSPRPSRFCRTTLRNREWSVDKASLHPWFMYFGYGFACTVILESVMSADHFFQWTKQRRQSQAESIAWLAMCSHFNYFSLLSVWSSFRYKCKHTTNFMPSDQLRISIPAPTLIIYDMFITFSMWY